MLSGNIDIDRGVTLKITGDGVEVYMYKDTPGVYLNAYSQPVTEELAMRAGFDTQSLGKQRKRREMLAKAALMIDVELENEDVELGKRKIVKERNGYTISSIGIGRHIINDPDGQQLHERPLTKEQAELLFDELVPAPVEAPRVKAEVKSNPGSVAPKSGKKD
jgi:hypothetical protein